MKRMIVALLFGLALVAGFTSGFAPAVQAGQHSPQPIRGDALRALGLRNRQRGTLRCRFTFVQPALVDVALVYGLGELLDRARDPVGIQLAVGVQHSGLLQLRVDRGFVDRNGGAGLELGQRTREILLDFYRFADALMSEREISRQLSRNLSPATSRV